MKAWGEKRVLFWGIALGLSAAPTAFASKIYSNGAWREAATVPTISAPNSNALFGSLGGPIDLRRSALNFLQANAGLLGADRDAHWSAPTVQSGRDLETHRIARTWRGLPIVGGEALVHFTRGKVQFATADQVALSHLSARPALSAAEASGLAFASYQGRPASAEDPQLQVLVLSQGDAKEAILAYKVKVVDRDHFSSDNHFIDANTGRELLVTTNVHTAARAVLTGAGDESDFDFEENRWKTIFSDNGCENAVLTTLSSQPVATIGQRSPSACLTTSPRVEASAKAAWTNSGLVHDFYLTKHGRRSIDNNNMTIRSVVNFGGTEFPNAAWFDDKKVMLYGFGDEAQHNDFALPLDVAGHEITHGVTSSTANLQYAAESGALNESYSDVFGKLIAFQFGKTRDWKLGSELFKDGTSFIRDLANPEVAHTREYKFRDAQCHRFNDYCGVHSNSGIPNKAAYLMSQKLGLERLGKIYYLTLTQLLRSNSTFKEARAQTEAACASLYGAGSQDCKVVSASFEAVGI